MERENLIGIPAQERTSRFLSEVVQTGHFAQILATNQKPEAASLLRAISVASKYYSSPDCTFDDLA